MNPPPQKKKKKIASITSAEPVSDFLAQSSSQFKEQQQTL
jgi:hypothetical protein